MMQLIEVFDNFTSVSIDSGHFKFLSVYLVVDTLIVVSA